MTETETQPTTAPTDDWNAQFAALKARFPKVKDSIVFAFHVLQSNPDIALDDLKAQAKLHGIKVTAASVNAARRLLARTSATDGVAASPARSPAAATPRRTRRPRAAAAPLDVEALIRTTVGKIQDQGAAEAERLREAIRKAIAVLEAAVTSSIG